MFYRLSLAFSYSRARLEYLKKTSEESIYIYKSKIERKAAGWIPC